MRRDIQAFLVVCFLILGITCISAGVSVAGIADDIDHAQQLLDGKDYDGAIQLAKQIASSNPNLAPRANYLIGECYEGKKDWSTAIETFKDLRIKHPNVEPEAECAMRELAKCYGATKAWDNAISIAEEALSKYPADASYWLRRLSTHCKNKGNKAKELVALQRLVKEFPNTIEAKEANLGIAEHLCMEGKVDQAIKDLDVLLSKNPDMKELILHQKVILLYRYTSDFAIALSIFNKMTSEELKQSVAFETMVKSRRPAQAKQIFELLISTCPNSNKLVMWEYYRGMCSFTAGDWASAREAYHSLCANRPASEWYTQAKYDEADCCIQMGDVVAAKTAFKEVIDKNPESELAKNAVRRLKAIEERS